MVGGIQICCPRELTHFSICSMSSAQNFWSSVLMIAPSGPPEARIFAAAMTHRRPHGAKPAAPEGGPVASPLG